MSERRGPGQPQIGEAVKATITTADLALIDAAIARGEFRTRSEAVRRLVSTALSTEGEVMSDTVKFLPHSQAKSVESRRCSEVLDTKDRFGSRVRANIWWMPMVLDAFDAGMENVGMSPVAWIDRCPASFEDTDTGGIRVRADVISAAATTQTVVEAGQVHSLEDLEPGTFFVEWL